MANSSDPSPSAPLLPLPKPPPIGKAGPSGAPSMRPGRAPAPPKRSHFFTKTSPASVGQQVYSWKSLLTTLVSSLPNERTLSFIPPQAAFKSPKNPVKKLLDDALRALAAPLARQES
ncbi:hypothetical protein QJS10_CPB21g00846 [Acorus calamus]|uniref:Uncharacterized protein n=1 Tax=Acorus calamus TaxID=4465 RepID=A0AAV9C4V7_ACOCL|nr:hypothetical protein QJS10_CPB21g00846 [Acorus calamus]